MSVLRRRGGVRYAALLAVPGPGLLAGLSDDDPAGITTYSVLGADYGYQLLWVLLLSRGGGHLPRTGRAMGVVTGQIDRPGEATYGVRALCLALVVANIGTTCAEFAGIAAGFEIFGISRYVSVPAAAAIDVATGIARQRFHPWVERLLLLVSTVFSPTSFPGSWPARTGVRALHGTLRSGACRSHRGRKAVAIVTAIPAPPLAPWGLSFHAVPMRSIRSLRTEDLALERVDVVIGAVLTGVIGFFVVSGVCGHPAPRRPAQSPTPPTPRSRYSAGGGRCRHALRRGLIGASFLAASIPAAVGRPTRCASTPAQAALDDPFREARTFYLTYGIITLVGTGIVLTPDIPAGDDPGGHRFSTRCCLIPLLVAMVGLGRDRGSDG